MRGAELEGMACVYCKGRKTKHCLSMTAGRIIKISHNEGDVSNVSHDPSHQAVETIKTAGEAKLSKTMHQSTSTLSPI